MWLQMFLKSEPLTKKKLVTMLTAHLEVKRFLCFKLKFYALVSNAIYLTLVYLV